MERTSQNDQSNRLHDKHYEYEQRKEYKRDMVRDNDLMGCTFQPMLMKSSMGNMEDYNTISRIGMQDTHDP